MELLHVLHLNNGSLSWNSGNLKSLCRQCLLLKILISKPICSRRQTSMELTFVRDLQQPNLSCDSVSRLRNELIIFICEGQDDLIYEFLKITLNGRWSVADNCCRCIALELEVDKVWKCFSTTERGRDASRLILYCCGSRCSNESNIILYIFTRVMTVAFICKRLLKLTRWHIRSPLALISFVVPRLHRVRSFYQRRLLL